MLEADRKLRLAFIDHMKANEAWPKEEVFVQWIRDYRDGIKSGVYGKMKDGTAIDPKHAVSLVEFFRERASKNEGEPSGPFFDYLRSVNVDIRTHSSETIAHQLLEEPEYDALQSGISGLIFETLNGKKLIHRYVRSCGRDERQVSAAVRWMYATVGYHCHPRGNALDAETAIAIGIEKIGLPIEEYTERAIAWAKFDSWTIVLAQGKRVPVGMSIALPLRDETYYALREGRLCSYDIQPDDLCRPSRYFFIEGLGERSVELGGEPGNQTRISLIAIACQIGILSHYPGITADAPIRCLTFAGTEKNRLRLKKQGYKPTGTTMPKIGVPFLEKVLDRPRSAEDILLMT